MLYSTHDGKNLQALIWQPSVMVVQKHFLILLRVTVHSECKNRWSDCKPQQQDMTYQSQSVWWAIDTPGTRSQSFLTPPRDFKILWSEVSDVNHDSTGTSTQQPKSSLMVNCKWNQEELEGPWSSTFKTSRRIQEEALWTLHMMMDQLLRKPCGIEFRMSQYRHCWDCWE